MIIIKDLAREPSRITRTDFLATVFYPYPENPVRLKTRPTSSVVAYGRAFSDAAILNTDAKMAEAARLADMARAADFRDPELISAASQACNSAARADALEAAALSWQEEAET